MVLEDSSVEELLARASRGDRPARDRLLSQYRNRLRQMVAVRIDRRLAARIDPSDVVQEALTHASQKLAEYLRTRPIAFYPWLRKIAWNRMVELHRRHVVAQKRSVNREEPQMMELPDESALELANRLVSRGSSPMSQLVRAEERDLVRAALTRLPPRDREVLVLRHLEQLSTAEMAAVLDISEGAVKVRHLRALERLRDLLCPKQEDEQ
jgi:RNA polymerase sigma-70 factor (ECF subfamily)